MRHTYTRRTIVSAGAAAALAIPFGVGRFSAFAQESTPIAEGGPALPPGCTVVASGLFNPRYVVVDADGTLFISEAGDAGDEEILQPVGEGTPEAAAPVLTSRGLTGQVTKVAPDGTQSVLATGLPSYSFGTEVVGAAGITISNGLIYLAIGGPGPATAFVDPIINQDSVVSIDPATGVITPVADIGGYERSKNPEPSAIDSNLYGLAAAPDGTLYVADAGGNTVYKIDPTTGEFSVLAVLPMLDFNGGPINPVPTGVSVGADGNIYVGLLSGAPFPAGGAKILQITPDGATITDALTNLTMVVDVEFSPDGELYASEISENFLVQPPANGLVLKRNADGTSTVVVPDLFLANGIAFDAEGNLYVVVNTSAPAGSPPNGMVLKCAAANAMGASTPAAMATPQP
jgi:sugar lactone lactonase YvrE